MLSGNRTESSIPDLIPAAISLCDTVRSYANYSTYFGYLPTTHKLNWRITNERKLQKGRSYPLYQVVQSLNINSSNIEKSITPEYSDSFFDMMIHLLLHQLLSKVIPNPVGAFNPKSKNKSLKIFCWLLSSFVVFWFIKVISRYFQY